MKYMHFIDFNKISWHLRFVVEDGVQTKSITLQTMSPKRPKKNTKRCRKRNRRLIRRVTWDNPVTFHLYGKGWPTPTNLQKKHWDGFKSFKHLKKCYLRTCDGKIKLRDWSSSQMHSVCKMFGLKRIDMHKPWMRKRHYMTALLTQHMFGATERNLHLK